MAYIHVCDLCGKPLSFSDNYSEYRIKKKWYAWPCDHGWERIDAHNDCVKRLYEAEDSRGIGEWREHHTVIQCSVCGAEFDDEVTCTDVDGWPWVYCPKCGAKMEPPKEDAE